MLQLAGIELYFNDVENARRFYRDVVGLNILDEEGGHYARFGSGPMFVCVERKGSESYSSQDKAVLFFRVADLRQAMDRIGRERFVQVEEQPAKGGRAWAVFHDPEGHNIVLIEQSSTA